jgi:uncharacterized phage protein gp47/JayE
MPNVIDENGLTIKTNSEIVADLVAEFQAIYGTDINVDSNSPDGQMIGIFAQAVTDLLELLAAVYNTFSVPNSFGVILDQRVALNGIARRQGTNTITDVTIVATSAVDLIGLDALVNDPEALVYTVSDDGGVQYQLIESFSIASPGTNVLAFQAKDVGIIEPIQNTITNQVTILTAISSVNNPDPATSIGTNEESDAELKIRQIKSFFLASTGPADAIEAALLAIPDVTDAFVAENDTDSPVDDVPAFSIWCIVEGGTDAEVGTAIYSKKSPGCGMKGGESYVVARPNGTSFTAKFDRALSEDLYIKFTLNSKVSGLSFDEDLIKTQLVAAMNYKLNQSPNIGDIVLAMDVIEPRAYLTVLGVSDDGMSYVDSISPTDFQYKFVLDEARIDITVP